MKKHLFLALCAGLMLTSAVAQKVPKKATAATPEKRKAPVTIPLSWGEKLLSENEKLSKTILLNLLQQPFATAAAVGEIGSAGRISSFAFTYAERAMYEDSVGNPLLLTDYLTEYCLGDTLSKNIKLLLPPKIKAGDTVYISDVKVALPAGGKPVFGRPVRLIVLP